MDFFLNFTSPTSQENLKIKELSFKQLRALNKFLHNKDNSAICQCFEKILNENIINYKNNLNLNCYDKFCALILLRLASIAPEIEIKKNNTTKKINLLPFYSQITALTFKTIDNIEENNIKIKFSLPKQLFLENIFLSFSSMIDEIQIENNKPINFQQLTQEEKQLLFDKLPATIVEKIYAYKQHVETEFKAIIFNIDEENNVELSPFNTSLFEILKVLFFTDLKSLYDIQYMLVSKVNYTPEYLDENTLLENIILMNNYSDEMAKVNNETKKALDVGRPANK